MPTIRGFVERLEIGRAGLATAGLLHEDGTRANYVIPDLDADPERFNERLSKFGLLRDAQNRAEPVEVEYEEGDGGRVVERVVRITRDALDTPDDTDTLRGMVVGVAILTENRTAQFAEAGDTAEVFLLTETGAVQTCVLNLQIPERGAAESQLALIRTAQTSGETITVFIDAKTRRITGVQSGAPIEGGGARLELVEGFVESSAHAWTTGALGGMALIELTTAPPFSGAGQVVDLVPFVPALRVFLVVVGSPEYDLFLLGLSRKLRMRIYAATPRDGEDRGEPIGRVAMRGFAVNLRSVSSATAGAETEPALVRGAQVLHALASASRPVWVQVSRKSLDVGPDAKCTEGLPSNDLTPRGLRDLHIPYTAEWLGLGCFNHGVYRFQFELEVSFEIYVDGKMLCVHASEDGKTQFAHACLDGEHEVRLVLCEWTCEQNFIMDVYRIR